MTNPRTAPYGSWKSPITPDLIVSKSNALGQIVLDGSDIYWGEGRPSEGGRVAIMRSAADGSITDVIPQPFNARTRVHEYGGGSFTVSNGTVYFSNFVDQQLYRVSLGSAPEQITSQQNLRYADAIMDQQRQRLICVGEDHSDPGREALNKLISVSLTDGDRIQTLVTGNDFYSSPRLSPDGSRLTWLTWNHPNMPWDGTELWVGEFDQDGLIKNAERLAGGPRESIFQPEWSPDGTLYFLSDRTNWWNFYRLRDGKIEPLCQKDTEFGAPQWSFGMSTYGFVSAQKLVCRYSEEGQARLSYLDTTTGQLTHIPVPYTSINNLYVTPEYIVFTGASPTSAGVIVRFDIASGTSKVLARASNVEIDERYLSMPQAIEFPTENGLTAHAFYYPPHNPDYVAPAGELPPLIVESHGGPTSASPSNLSLGRQFWTSRGFALLDVNYGGSTGYGREYRERLYGQWGVVDVDDCANGAKYLVERGLVDGNRLAIHGGSAGGYTTLCALAFRDTFNAGASHFGVSDLDIFVKDTHKFESRYLFSLIGPYPEARDLYYQRSAINFTDRFSSPVIFFQGLEDKVVPPNQAELMVDALRKKKIPVAYVPFEGEQHGFRRAENIKRALEAELYFYSRIFNFEPADKIEPVAIENL
ncbi:MAG TPA: S9 family peptidase [Ktedonobacteraceae bacterium]|nr:S9 family peptidase [Ktedonobacteraceae bacterium]